MLFRTKKERMEQVSLDQLLDEVWKSLEMSEAAQGKVLIRANPKIIEAQERDMDMIAKKIEEIKAAKSPDRVYILSAIAVAMSGFTAKDYTFSDDGKMITETDAHGNVKTTTFVDKSHIEEEYAFVSGKRYRKTTTFVDKKNIQERIVEIDG